MLNPAAFTQCLHMTLAAFVAVGFTVPGIHALRLRQLCWQRSWGDARSGCRPDGGSSCGWRWSDCSGW